MAVLSLGDYEIPRVGRGEKRVARQARSDVTSISTTSSLDELQPAAGPYFLRLVPVEEPTAINRPVNGSYVRWGKHVADCCFACLLIVLSAPLLVVSLAFVRVLLGPEVLLRQSRVGRNGQVFDMYKVRTMNPDRRAPRRWFGGSDRRLCHKRDDDPRHTPLGRLLRKLSIDELPQLFNVLRGEMSLIGPRPEMESVVEQYGLRDHPRHAVRPGITGPWQVSALRSLPLHENMQLDTDYVRDLSWRTDLAVLRATLGALRRPSGH